ncbi:conserved hypothetical protein [Lebetimonas natsushimae]|uniref:MIP18 family-like domain-containing protein n=1 Tax=Lebetimonas natsushimae TaxID=1936991 RepID=A0A292YBA2_9BACT|nr:iron-sulfur cluster assembly protein [Lebetimonas natsushimae]GAX88252.1 conserved hypothetical protein [Lebetimonas natsushimae]
MDFFEIVKAIESIQHPAIATSLTNLGILQDIDIEGDTVKATFVWPFEGIPIRDQIINSVKNAVGNMGLKLDYNERIMSEDEKQRFLELEKKYWRGGQAACGV